MKDNNMNTKQDNAAEAMTLLLQTELNKWHWSGPFEVHSVTQSTSGPEWFNALVFQDGEEFGIEFLFELHEDGTLDMSDFEYELEGGASFASESECERRAIQGQA